MRAEMEVERWGGEHIEYRAVTGTEEDCEMFILHVANTYGTTHVLERGKRVRTVTPAEAKEKLDAMRAL